MKRRFSMTAGLAVLSAVFALSGCGGGGTAGVQIKTLPAKTKRAAKKSCSGIQVQERQTNSFMRQQ